ncbi:MAG TPA: hypothetical protein VGK67_21220 [Myxococcales bacterium]|jgi:hypothetical protein
MTRTLSRALGAALLAFTACDRFTTPAAPGADAGAESPDAGPIAANCLDGEGPAQGPWVRCAAGAGAATAVATAVATDSAGNVYVTGAFTQTIGIGAVTLTASGFADILLAKYDAQGKVQWARRFGGGTRTDDSERGTAVAVAPDGSIFLAGIFVGIADFGGGYVLQGTPNGFLLKLSPAGDTLWARQGGDFANALAVDAAGACYLTGKGLGWTRSAADPVLGPLVRFDDSGAVLWELAQQFEEGRGLAVDADGNAVLIGKGGTPELFGLTPDDPPANFSAKVSAAGEVLWAKPYELQATGVLGVQALPTKQVAAFVLFGQYAGTEIDLGNGVKVTTGTNEHTYLLTYGPDGTAQSAQPLGAWGSSYFLLSEDLDLVSGGSCRIDAVLDATTTLTCPDGNSAYVARYDPAGKVRWVAQATPETSLSALAFDPTGNIVAVGQYSRDRFGKTPVIDGVALPDLTLGSSTGWLVWKVPAGRAAGP